MKSSLKIPFDPIIQKLTLRRREPADNDLVGADLLLEAEEVLVKIHINRHLVLVLLVGHLVTVRQCHHAAINRPEQRANDAAVDFLELSSVFN